MNRIHRRAHHFAKFVLATIALGTICAAATYWVHMSSVQLACVPTTGGALDEVYAHTQYGHGFPWSYYYDRVPENCGVSNTSALIGKVATQGFQWLPFVADMIVWGGLSTKVVVELVWHRKRRQARRTGDSR